MSEELKECPTCEGTGWFAKKDWNCPAIYCDECNGTGLVPEEKPDPVRDDSAMDGEPRLGKTGSGPGGKT